MKSLWSGELRQIGDDPDAGSLTKAEALQALASVGALTEGAWRKAFLAASPALRSEMFFAALGDVGRYPWLPSYVRAAKEPALAIAATE